MSPEVQAAIIGAGATLVAAIVGFGALIMQMRSQGTQGRDAIAENERRKLKAEMYEQAVAVCRETADAAIKMSTRLRTMMHQLSISSEAAAAGRAPYIPNARYSELLSLNAAFSNSALRFVFLVENRQIVDPRILVFRTAMATVLHDLRGLLSNGLTTHVMPALPVETVDGKMFPYTPPSADELEKIDTVANEFIGALTDAIGYTEDFLVEMQNHLLGDLFGTKVRPRVPLDPTVKVITLERAEELERWFRTETDWGKTAEDVEAQVRAKF